MNGDGINRRDIQWFPGHMTKTLRMMEKEIRQIDCALILLDARIPQASRNPELERIAGNKPRLYLLNKADLADPAVTAAWESWFRAQGAGCRAISAREKKQAASVKKLLLAELSRLLEKREAKGMAGARVRVMVAGIPNVGKSTFINSVAGGAHARAEDRPGVTRGKQWIAVERFDLLDVPGVLWKKFDSRETAVCLAATGSIRDEVLDTEELAAELLDRVRALYPDSLRARYKLDAADLAFDPPQLLERIARRRGMLMSGGVTDTERAAAMVLDEFRGGKWGRISLERPPESEAQHEQPV